jgi:hypothetical protein
MKYQEAVNVIRQAKSVWVHSIVAPDQGYHFKVSKQAALAMARDMRNFTSEFNVVVDEMGDALIG